MVSKEVESTIEYVCKVGACMETHDQVGVRKQLKRQRFSNKKNSTGFKGEMTSTAIESVTLLLYVRNRNTLITTIMMSLASEELKSKAIQTPSLLILTCTY